MSSPVALALLAAAWVACGGCARESPRLLDGLSATLRGHRELILRDGAAPRPLVIGRGERVGLCLETGSAVDTSQWRSRLWFEGSRVAAARDGTYDPPAARLGTTLCFDAELPDGQDAGDLSVCGELRDGFDDATAALPCVPFRFTPADATYAGLQESMKSVLARRDTATAEALVADLDALGARASASGYPLFELRLRLIAAFLLRRAGTEVALRSAAERLAFSPAWLASGAAASLAAQLAYERATLALATRPRLELAWQHLREAEARYRRIADPKLVSAIMKQAEILAGVGATVEACDRLRDAIDRCREVPCEPTLVPAAESTLAWLLLQDPDASDEQLEAAEGLLRRAAEARVPSQDPLEEANRLVNLAYGRVRRGLDPGPAAREAKRLLDPAGPVDDARARWLSGWLQVIEGEQALARDEIDRARALCSGAAGDSRSATLSARGLGCAARALRAAGRLDEAARAMERALFLHGNAASGFGQSIALGPGRRADDFYAAARMALERGRARRAWDILRDLDELTAREERTRDCKSPSDGALEREHDEVLAELAALDAPASGARRAQRQEIRRSLLERLRELTRARPACAGPSAPPSDATVEFRAVPLEDEIVVLRQAAAGAVEPYRRTPFARKELVRLTREIRRALDQRDPMGPAEWSALVAKLAESLVPRPDDVDALTTFALHGALQEVPLAALPLPSPRSEGPRWLGDLTVVAYRPAGAVTHAQAGGAGGAARVFVVDPTENLAFGPALARFYRTAFPESTVLEGRAASVAEFLHHLPAARWLHIDAHARHDPAFPELTELELADGPVTAGQLGSRSPALELANLSACQSGRWPITADSGRFGLAGLLARRGAAWVIGTRADLPDALANDFNRSLYDHLSRGETIPGAFGTALRTVRGSHPVTSWASILLLQSEPESEREPESGPEPEPESGSESVSCPSPTLSPSPSPWRGGRSDPLRTPREDGGRAPWAARAQGVGR